MMNAGSTYSSLRDKPPALIRELQDKAPTVRTTLQLDTERRGATDVNGPGCATTLHGPTAS